MSNARGGTETALPELLIFDCDGVLVDSEPLAARVFSKTLERFGVSLATHEVEEQFTGLSASQSIDLLRLRGLETAPTFMEAFERALAKEIPRSLMPMPGALQVISSLLTKKAVASNSSRAQLLQKLRVAGLFELLDPRIFSADAVERPKPAPDLFLFVAESCGVPPARCLVVEDSLSGLRAARQAGMRAVAFQPSKAVTTYCRDTGITTFDELAALVTMVE